MIPKDISQQLFELTGNREFPKEYIDQVFFIWFEAGKPGSSKLYRLIQPVTGTTILPGKQQLHNWIHNDFIKRSEELDKQIIQQLTENTIASRVEMLNRHIEIGKKMQSVAIDWLESHMEEMNANAAVRLLVEGVRVERESAGIPEAIEKMTQMSDEQLLKEIGEIISKSPGRLEANV